MVAHMKTTINISTALYEEVRRTAQEENTTVKALIEEGLRHTLATHKKRIPFTLRKVTFKGNGCQPDFADTSWTHIRNAVYEGRGG